MDEKYRTLATTINDLASTFELLLESARHPICLRRADIAKRATGSRAAVGNYIGAHRENGAKVFLGNALG